MIIEVIVGAGAILDEHVTDQTRVAGLRGDIELARATKRDHKRRVRFD